MLPAPGSCLCAALGTPPSAVVISLTAILFSVYRGGSIIMQIANLL